MGDHRCRIRIPNSIILHNFSNQAQSEAKLEEKLESKLKYISELVCGINDHILNNFKLCMNIIEKHDSYILLFDKFVSIRLDEMARKCEDLNILIKNEIQSGKEFKLDIENKLNQINDCSKYTIDSNLLLESIKNELSVHREHFMTAIKNYTNSSFPGNIKEYLADNTVLIPNL